MSERERAREEGRGSERPRERKREGERECVSGCVCVWCKQRERRHARKGNHMHSSTLFDRPDMVGEIMGL